VRTYPAGTDVTVACQARGSAFGTTTVWDKLTDGSYVTDFRVDTPSDTGFSAPVARCRYPCQVTIADGANQRGGPGASYAVTGRLPGGALAWVVCQQAGLGQDLRRALGLGRLRRQPGRDRLQQTRAPLLTPALPPLALAAAAALD